MLQKRIGWAWRTKTLPSAKGKRRTRLGTRNVARYVAYLEATAPEDRISAESLDDLRVDGHVWPKPEPPEYGSRPPRRPIVSDEEEKELRRQEDARSRAMRDNCIEFFVAKHGKE